MAGKGGVWLYPTPRPENGDTGRTQRREPVKTTARASGSALMLERRSDENGKDRGGFTLADLEVRSCKTQSPTSPPKPAPQPTPRDGVGDRVAHGSGHGVETVRIGEGDHLYARIHLIVGHLESTGNSRLTDISRVRNARHRASSA